MNSKKLDQFYTNPHLAERLYGLVKSMVGDGAKWLEPSSGSGSFSDILMKNREDFIAIDIDPKKDYMVEGDYLSTTFDVDVVLGNPPFGKNSSLAVKFFNKAAKESSVIAMILPRTFEKEFFHNKLDKRMNLVHNEVLPQDSFIFNGEVYSVPCVFQVWSKGEERCEVSTNNIYLSEVDRDSADFSIRRVGGRAGEVLDGVAYNASSVYFVKDLLNVKDTIRESYKELNLLAERTSGMKSITLKEISYFLDKLN